MFVVQFLTNYYCLFQHIKFYRLMSLRVTHHRSHPVQVQDVVIAQFETTAFMKESSHEMDSVAYLLGSPGTIEAEAFLNPSW